MNLCARLVEERVRARISARSLLRAIWDDIADAGTDGMAEPTDEWMDTEDVDGGLDNLGVSMGVVSRDGSRGAWVMTEG